MAEKLHRSTFLIIGGGIAGVSCAEHLSFLCPGESITLITATDLIKSVVNLKQHGRHLEEFDVEEKPIDSLSGGSRNINVVKATVKTFDPKGHSTTTEDGEIFHYEKLCICTGGRPKVIHPDSPHVIGIRDTQSVNDFQKRLANARRVVIVGNGGIALELVYELRGCEVVWAIKDDAIGNTFFDKGAATFFLPHLESDRESGSGQKYMQPVVKRMKYGAEDEDCSPPKEEKSGSTLPCGGALGPDWSSGLRLHGSSSTENAHWRQVRVEYECEVEKILQPEESKELGFNDTPFSKSPNTRNSPTSTAASDIFNWPVYVRLTNGKIYGCDFVVSATGVLPNVGPFISGAKFDLADDGGIKVDNNMRTNISDVYAAGDVCNASWEPSKFWFQMRLWSQARQMGACAARCMNSHVKGEEIALDFCFELFAHVTQFFGFKVILLGKYNAQDLSESDSQLLLRCTKGQEYVKVVLHNGRMYGAVLIGDTDLEETFENLILNEMDLSEFGESLLDPRVDIDNFFD